MSLEDIRKNIDALDGELLRLLNQRADLVHQVGEIKKKDGLEIYAPEREESLLQGLVTKSRGRLPEKSIRAIYREIMSAALALEENLKIAYLGPKGTWTHQAAVNKFGHSVSYVEQDSLSDVFDQVARKQADYGVVPIENSTEGAVNHTLDMFADSPLKICAQILLPIENALMANIPRSDITRLYSHPQVFGQCRDWIHKHFPAAELIEVSSTTRAAAMVTQESGAAALGGKLAATIPVHPPAMTGPRSCFPCATSPARCLMRCSLSIPSRSTCQRSRADPRKDVTGNTISSWISSGIALTRNLRRRWASLRRTAVS
jgi:chorismate mutase/prephenate dehydratase